MQAKSAPNRRNGRAHSRERPKGFGTEVTADHFIAKDEIDISINGDKAGLVIHDRGSNWIDHYALPGRRAGKPKQH